MKATPNSFGHVPEDPALRTTARHADGPLVRRARQARHRAAAWLLQRQCEAGNWCGTLQGDASLESDYILLLAWLKREHSAPAQKAAASIRRQQEPHGGWSLFPGGDLDISCSVKAYFALKLTGQDPHVEFMQRARDAMLCHGGAAAVDDVTRFFLALLGQISYDRCPALPPEFILPPTWLPWNLDRRDVCSQDLLVPLSIVWSRQPLRKIKLDDGIGELFLNESDRRPEIPAGETKLGQRSFNTDDRAVTWLERHGIRPLRKRALKRAEHWITNRLVARDGLDAELTTVLWNVVALKCLDHDDHSPEVSYCHERLNELIVEEEATIRLQPGKSPLADTACALQALAAAQVDPAADAWRRAADWLLETQLSRTGEGTRATAGIGESQRTRPEIGDTTLFLQALHAPFERGQLPSGQPIAGLVVSARFPDLRQARAAASRTDRLLETCEQARRWLLATQHSAGSWGSTGTHSPAGFWSQVRFPGKASSNDTGSPDVTGQALHALGIWGMTVGDPAVDRAVEYLRDTQESDGSWFGRWGVNYVYGTWLALTGLSEVNVPREDPAVVRGAHWLLSHQQENGAWGESPRSYSASTTRGHGPTTASQTAWALLGLMAAGLEKHSAVERGMRYLLDHQSPTGAWRECEFTATWTPQRAYVRNQLSAVYFPLLAVSRWLQLFV